MSRLSRVLVSFAFAAWLATPLVLTALGVSSGFAALERRRAAKLPKPSTAEIFDSELYAAFADYFADRIPLRAPVVVADSWIDLAVFGDSPSSEVFLGADGWLFSRGSIMVACDEQVSAERVVAKIRQVDRILRASGRRLIFLVAPNKAAIYPQHLGPAASLAECSRDFRREFRSRLRRAELADSIDLWEALESLKQRIDRAIYWPHDTHWTPEAALEATRRIVERLDPVLWDESRVVTIPSKSHRGDLGDMIGRPTWDPTVDQKVERGVKVRSLRGRFRHQSASGEVFSKRVLVIDDSFGRMYRHSLSQFLGDSTWIQWRIITAKNRASIVGEFACAEVVIFEIVERSLSGLSRGHWKDLPIRLVDELLGEMPAVELDPRRVEAKTSRVLLDLPAADAGGLRYLIVDHEIPGRRPNVVAKLPGQGWRNIRRVELSTEERGRRIGMEIPPEVTLVAIRWGVVRAAWLVDVPG